MANVSLLLRLENVGSGRCSFREGFSDLILLPAIDVPEEKALQRTYCSLAGAFPLHCSSLFIYFFLLFFFVNPETNRWTHSCGAPAAIPTAFLCKTCSSLRHHHQTPRNGFTTNLKLVTFNEIRRYRVTRSQTHTPSKKCLGCAVPWAVWCLNAHVVHSDRKQSHCPQAKRSDQDDIKSVILFHSHCTSFNDVDADPQPLRCCWGTAALSQAASLIRTPGTEKSLKDLNHKWITADTSVPPDGGKKNISIYINEGKIVWAVYQGN